MTYFLVGGPLLITFMLGVLAERWRWSRAVAAFETRHRCCECGGRTLLPISLWRCERDPNNHTMTGPAIAFEIRERLSPGRDGKTTPAKTK